MNTPAHIIFAATAFGKVDHTKVTLAAIFGGIAPDLSLYLMAGWALFVAGIDPEIVFGKLYFSDSWQLVFAIDNSFILWSAGLAVALWTGSTWLIALTGAGLMHLALDFPFHHDDGRMHFWPFSSWIFQSPLSYWDPRHFGHIIGPIEIGAASICLVILWRRFQHWGARAAIAAIGSLELAPIFFWVWVFAGG